MNKNQLQVLVSMTKIKNQIQFYHSRVIFIFKLKEETAKVEGYHFIS